MKLEPIFDSKKNQIIQLTHKDRISRELVRLSRYFVMGIVISLFVFAFSTATYLGISQSANSVPNPSVYQNPSTLKTVKSSIFTDNVQDKLAPDRSYQNCLAYGSGESLTVTCPTQYGFVYKAILDMPKDLAQKFSDAVFSIRGLGVTEKFDGSVILQYQNGNYRTNFFAS